MTDLDFKDSDILRIDLEALYTQIPKKTADALLQDLIGRGVIIRSNGEKE